VAKKIEVETENAFKERLKEKSDLQNLVKTFYEMKLSDVENWVNDNFVELSAKSKSAILKIVKVLWALVKIEKN
jgi:hypothetical protein